MDMHHRMVGLIKCRYCMFRCNDEEQLNKHSSISHKFVCSVCDKPFATSSGYSTHYKVQHMPADDLCVCNICGKKFSCQSRLEIHKRQHSEKRTFLCTICNKSYKHKKNLDNHPCNLNKWIWKRLKTETYFH